MSTPQLTRLSEHLRRLKLFTIQTRLEAALQEASSRELSYTDFLDQLLSEEVTAKGEKHVAMRTVMARLPYRKTLESFDFGFQPSLDRKKIQELATCRFVEHGENVLFLGPESHPPRDPDAVYLSAGPGRRFDESLCRESVRGTVEGLLPAQASDPR